MNNTPNYLQFQEFVPLRPPIAALQIRHRNDYIKFGSDEKSIRMIFDKVPYDDYEYKIIEKMKKEIKDKNITIPLYYRDSDILRRGMMDKRDIAQNVQILKQHIEWLQNRQDEMTDDIRQILESGLIYLCGVDRLYRPIIYINFSGFVHTKMIEKSFEDALIYVLRGVHRHMLLDYYIENFVVIIDTNEQGIFQAPLSFSIRILETLKTNFVAQIHHIYIINASYLLTSLWYLISGFIPTNTLKKISIIGKSKLDLLKKEIDESMIQLKYGGNLQNIEQYWPPYNFNSTQIQIPIDYKLKEFLRSVNNSNEYLISFEDNKPKHILSNIISHNSLLHQDSNYISFETIVYEKPDKFQEMKNLRPSIKALEVFHTDQYIQRGTKLKSNRQIYGKQKFNAWENSLIKQLKVEINKANIQIPIKWNDHNILKRAYMDQKSQANNVKSLQEYINWLNNDANHILTQGAKNILEQGIIYQFGRDKQYRPIFALNLHQLDLKIHNLQDFELALCYMISSIQQNMFLTYHIENLICMIEVNEMGIFSFPFQVTQRVIQLLKQNFNANLHHLYIMNPSYLFKTSWNVIKNILDPFTAKKISFLSKQGFNELLEFIDSDQLLQKYGGSAPDLQVPFWPPINTFPQQQQLSLEEIYFLQQLDPINFFQIRNYEQLLEKQEKFQPNILQDLQEQDENNFEPTQSFLSILDDDENEIGIKSEKIQICNFCCN